MSTDTRLLQAVSNNALWCDTVCRTHGRPGQFLNYTWINRRETPRFYPNMVTLSGAEAVPAQMASIESLVAAGLPGDWAVKDSFATLDLTPLSFHLLFDAEWLYRPASCPRPEITASGVVWRKLTEAAELARWEAAWAGESEIPAGTEGRIFLPDLLAEPEVVIFAAYRQSTIVAGGIANRTGEVVGLSNLFFPMQEAEEFRAGCVRAVMDTFPSLPLVGYETGPALTGSLALGFESLGTLRVWATG